MIIDKLNISIKDHELFFEEIDSLKRLKDIWSLLELSGRKIYIGYDKERSLCLIATDIWAMRSIYIYKNVVTDNVESLGNLEIDEKSINYFLGLGFMVAPKTLYKNLIKLPAGCVLVINTNELSKKFVPISTPKENETLNSFESLMKEHCFRFPLNYNASDTALAFSGGLDSSLILNSLYDQNVKSTLITINVEGGRDESYYQNIANSKIGYEHYKFKMSENDALKIFRNLCQDKEILGHPIVLKYEFLSKCVKDNGFKNLITGEGSDDLFAYCGLHSDINAKKAEILSIHPDLTPDLTHITLPFYESNSVNETGVRLANFALMGNANYYFLYKSAAKRNLKILLPYLDLQMIKYSLFNADNHSSYDKKCLISKFAQGRLPQEIINRKKQGFRSDSELWFKKRHVFYDEIMNLLALAPNNMSEIREYCLILLNDIQNTGSKKTANTLFCVMMLLGWIKENFGIKGEF